MQLIQWILLSFIATVHCFPDGAPSCKAKVPHHDDFTAQTGEPPYSLEASTPEQDLGGQTQVTITIIGEGDKTFKGFHLTARAPESNATLGKFTETDEGHTLECDTSSNAITHNDNKVKTSVSFIWTAPPGFNGDVEFRATVVMDFKNFYTNVGSSQLTI